MPYRVIPENVRRRFWDKVEKTETCWLCTGSTSDFGHGCVRVGGKQIRAHRWSWEQENGPIPAGLCVLHRCDVPNCVRPSHLFLGTKADNTADMLSKGRGRGKARYGEDSGSAKLTEQQVRDIRERYSGGVVTQSRLAAEYGVCQSNISFIVRGSTWKTGSTKS